MAYQKDEINKTITFTFSVQKIFNNVSLRSHYRAKNLQTESGDSLIDIYALSEDEKDVFNISLEDISAELYGILLKMMSEINDASVISGEDVIFKVKDNQAYNPNSVILVDKALQKALIDGVLYQWFDAVAQDNFADKFKNDYEEDKRNLKERLFQLKKKIIF